MCYSYVYHLVCQRCGDILEVTTVKKQECYRASCGGEIKDPSRILKKWVVDEEHLRWWCTARSGSITRST